MPHLIEAKIHSFLEQVKQGNYKIPKNVLDKFSKSTQEAFIKNFETKPREFKLSMGNIGKPSCQLIFEMQGEKSNIDPVRNFYGYLTEHLLMFLIHASGIKVISEQERVSIDISGQTINGVLDLILDLGDGYHTVWDIKSASNWSFKNKFQASFDKFIEGDSFGYVHQLFLYTAAKRKTDKRIKAGGFIAFDKSSGEIGILEIPREKEPDKYELSTLEFCARQIESLSKAKQRSIELCEDNKPDVGANELSKYNILGVESGMVELQQRCFESINELWRKKPTGNRYLGPICSFCDHKFKCWPGLKLMPQPNSEGKNPKFLYYTELKEKDNG